MENNKKNDTKYVAHTNLSKIDITLQKILDIRESRGWSEYKLAEESGISQSTISAWYSGSKKRTTPTLDSLLKVAEAFDVEASYLLIGDEERTFVLTDKQIMILNYWAKLNKVMDEAITALLKACADKT